jgi:uncharacterized lipoprotein YajG
VRLAVLVALVALLLLAGCAGLEWHFGVSNTWEFDIAEEYRRR